MPNKPPTPCNQCRRLTCNHPPTTQHRGPGSTFKTWAQIKRRRGTVDNWRRQYGNYCPGYQRDGHQTDQLTADHLVPVAAGGDETGELSVLCRSCNSRKHTATG